jgi:hypothetical protein
VQLGAKGPPFLSSLPLGKHHSQVPQETQRGGDLSLAHTVLRPLPLRQLGVMLKDGYCFVSETASLSLCLSVFGTEENGHIRTNWSIPLQSPQVLWWGLFGQL